MDRRVVRRTRMNEEGLANAIPLTDPGTPPQRRQRGRPRLVTASPTEKSSPRSKVAATLDKVKETTNITTTKGFKEATIRLTKLTPAQTKPASEKLPAKSEILNTATRVARTAGGSSPALRKEISNVEYKEKRISVSRQSDISTGSTARTVDITPAVNDNDMHMGQEVNERLSQFIRRSASKGLKNIADTVRRSMSREVSVAPSESRYSRSVSRSYFDEEEEYSDLDPTEVEAEEQHKYYSMHSEQHVSSTQSFLCRPYVAPREFGGAIGLSVLLLAVPLLVTYIMLATSKIALPWPYSNYKEFIDHVFPAEVISVYMCYQLGIFVLSAILIGRKVCLPRETFYLTWKFNALPLAICVNLLLMLAAYVAQYNVVEYVLEQQWRFCIYGLLHAYITAIWAYTRSLYNKTPAGPVNAFGKSGNIIIDFALGREINPKWLQLVDLKQCAYRAQLITTLLLAECYLLQALQLPDLQPWPENIVQSAQLWWQDFNGTTPTFWAAAMLLLYVLDAILFEHHLASSFELQAEGYGCLLLLRYAATPYLLSGLVRYAHCQELNVNCQLAYYGAMLLLIAGLFVKRLSCAVKYQYRLNPGNPYFRNIESIHTFQGRRLLLDGFWGRLRQPNYAGDILALIALCVPFVQQCIWQAHLGILLIVILLLHRATRVNTRNKQRYHSSWVRYSQLVRDYVLPKIF